jgi:endonuclease/exonuclease/phosphatase family metal-dependent hydrolase
MRFHLWGSRRPFACRGRQPLLVRSIHAVAVAAILFGWIVSASAAVRITTWNLEWFPNRGPEELTAPEQDARIKGAADVLRPLDPDIILLQEIKDFDACTRLAEAIKPGAYKVAICSAFREGREIGKQQVAILAREPAVAAFAEPWRSMAGVDPPRGFAFGWFRIKGQEVGVYSVHLKSNRVSRGRGPRPKKGQRKTFHQRKAEEEGVDENVKKREVSVDQFLAHVRDVMPRRAPSLRTIVIGGDFNTNKDRDLFAKETTLTKLAQAGFRDAFEGLPASQRVTIPGKGQYPDATFDYIFYKNAAAGPAIITPSRESDHFVVSVDLEVGKSTGPAPVLATQPAAATPPSQLPAAATATTAPGPPASGSVSAATPSVLTPVPVDPAQDSPVWVHLPTGVYFRPGALLYGKTGRGRYMKESEAVQAGYKPAIPK